MQISVIIPVYNKSNTIEDTIESVVHQLDKSDELILVNDGSTDNSLDIMQRYASDNVMIYSKDNGGESDARNYGIDKANNEWIAFLDGDDQFSENYLAETRKHIYNIANKNVVICHMTKHIRKGALVDKAYEIKKIVDGVHIIDMGYYYHINNFFLASIILSLVSSSSIVVKKERINGAGYYLKGMKRGADREYYIRLFKNDKSIHLLKKSYSYIDTLNNGRVSNNIHIPYKHELAYIHRNIKDNDIKKYLRYHLIRRTYLLLRRRQVIQAIKLITLLRYHLI